MSSNKFLRFSLALLIMPVTMQSYAQVDSGIRKKQLRPTFIDTTKENIFIFELPNVIIYFKQGDIKSFIDNPGNQNILANYGSEILRDTVMKRSRQIKITDFYFSYDQHQRDSIFRKQRENILTKKLNEEFYFLAAKLMLKGQFMVYSKTDEKLITKGLFVRRQKGYLGQRSLVFYLQYKRPFYMITTVLGE